MDRKTPETAFFSERRWPALSEAEIKLHALIVPEHKKKAINPYEFADLYGKETVDADLKELERLEAGFAKSDDPEHIAHLTRGELFEAVISDQIESSDWLGENAEVIVPSHYDDVKNGIDGIIEFEEEGGKSHFLH